MSELNNLLSFKDFNGELPLNKQKRTKRTDVGFDVLNENFYDRLLYKANNDRPISNDMFKQFGELLIKSIKSGTVSEFEKRECCYYFELRGREFKINSDGTASIKTSRNIKTDIDDDGNKTHTRIWTTFELPGDISEDIKDALDDIDYL